MHLSTNKIPGDPCTPQMTHLERPYVITPNPMSLFPVLTGVFLRTGGLCESREHRGTVRIGAEARRKLCPQLNRGLAALSTSNQQMASVFLLKGL